MAWFKASRRWWRKCSHERTRCCVPGTLLLPGAIGLRAWHDQPIDPCKPAEAEDQPKPPAEEKKPVPPAKKPSEILLYKRKRPDIDTHKSGGPAKQPEAPDKGPAKSTTDP